MQYRHALTMDALCSMEEAIHPSIWDVVKRDSIRRRFFSGQQQWHACAFGNETNGIRRKMVLLILRVRRPLYDVRNLISSMSSPFVMNATAFHARSRACEHFELSEPRLLSVRSICRHLQPRQLARHLQTPRPHSSP